MQYAFLFVAAAFIFLSTTLGAATVFLFRRARSPRLLATFLGAAAGVMFASSVWSLLLPSLELAESRWGKFAFFPTAAGFAVGGVFLFALEKFSPERAQNGFRRLFLSVTLHNIPEGLAVGFALGVAATRNVRADYIAALGLAFGVGVQNLPEGFAVALPAYLATGRKGRAFAFGTASGAPEPLFATIGFFLSSQLVPLQPWLLAFAAGAMIFVSVRDLLPEANAASVRLSTCGFFLGFLAMMILDVFLG